jgi:hypothetical protein
LLSADAVILAVASADTTIAGVIRWQWLQTAAIRPRIEEIQNENAGGSLAMGTYGQRHWHQ